MATKTEILAQVLARPTVAEVLGETLAASAFGIQTIDLALFVENANGTRSQRSQQIYVREPGALTDEAWLGPRRAQGTSALDFPEWLTAELANRISTVAPAIELLSSNDDLEFALIKQYKVTGTGAAARYSEVFYLLKRRLNGTARYVEQAP